MIGFIGTSVKIPLNYNQYSSIADLHPFHFIVAHALGFSVSTSRLLETDFNMGTITSNHCEVFFDPILHCLFSLSISLYAWNLLVRILNSLDSTLY
jgi:hypothetical protein